MDTNGMMDLDEPKVSQEASSSKDSTQSSLPWFEKYRPHTLKDLISHDEIVNTLEKLVNSGKMPHLLLYGPPGTGKTSTILALAMSLNGANYKNVTLELNASDDRTISMVRDRIKDFASTKKMFDKGLKLIILDEADAIVPEAQAALRRIMEQYSKTTRFCLICNHVNKIAPAIQSRCTRFRFGPIPEAQIKSRLDYIVMNECVNITDAGLKAVVRLGGGDMRKTLNILQASFMAFPNSIDENDVYSCTGNPLPTDVQNIVESMLNKDFETSYNEISSMKTEKGYALQDIITHVHNVLTRLKLDTTSRITLYKSLASIEYRLASGSSEKLQLSAMISAFMIVRAGMEQAESSSSKAMET